MRNWIHKIIALILCIGMLLPVFGCHMSQDGQSAAQPTANAVSDVTPAPTATPTPTPVPPAGERFDALDKDFFTQYVTSDGYTFHQMVSDPEKFGIDASAVEMTLGDFSEAANKELAADYQTYLDELSSIPREELTQRQQVGYDVLEEYLELSIQDASFEYYYEPLTKISGAQSNLPLSMALYEIYTAEDIDNYLLLMADLPRYMGQILDYEREKSLRGRFMTEAALDEVLKACQEIIDAKDTSFLIAVFNDQVDQVEGLTSEQAETYKQKNLALVTGPFIEAFQSLCDGLEELRSTCSPRESFYATDEEALGYFELCLKNEASSDITVDEALALLEGELYNLLIDYSTIQMEHPEAFETTHGMMTTGDTQKDLDYLKELSADLIGPLPEHALNVNAYPEELENSLSAASYVIPSIDGWYQNEMFINNAKIDETDTFLSTLAHETYPGHMYQYVYQRAIEDMPLSQKVLHLGGYAEGWSQTAERIMTVAQDQFDTNYYLALFYNSMIVNVILPAIISINVNYKGGDLEEVKSYLASYFNDEAIVNLLADAYYDWAIDVPFYTFNYALGYAQISSMIRSAKNDLGDGFDQKAYLNHYLDLGQGYYDALKEQMDAWVDSQMTN